MNARSGSTLLKRLFFGCFAGVLAVSVVSAQDDPPFAPEDYAFVRSLRATAERPRWANSSSLAARLAAWRSDINMFEPGQNPISPRYIVTCYGGVIDLRHFLYTACKVLSERGNRHYWKGQNLPLDERYARRPYRSPFAQGFRNPEFQIQSALYDTYCVERGREFALAKQIESPEEMQELIEAGYWDCTPEDLPSSALGAAFAVTLMRHRDPLAVDVELELGKFLAPFIPVSDKVREGISHRKAVFGVAEGEPVPPELLVWFTAEPVLLTALINEQAREADLGKLCDEVKDGREGLAKAGYEVAPVSGGMPLRIRPVQ